MSGVKYQLLKLLPSLSSEARKTRDEQIKQRFYLLKRVAESPRSVTLKCQKSGISKDQFYKWAKRLLKGKTLLSLQDESKRPKRSPKKTPKRIEKRIRNLRRLEPFSGCETISHELKLHYNIECPPSTVNKVLNRLGFISKKAQERLTKKHIKRYRREKPGFLQMDFKYVPYKINNKQFYQLSAIDHHSSWRFIRIYGSKDTDSTIEFLNELKDECPFAIFEIQTDNDAAFTDKFTHGRVSGQHAFDYWCSKNQIRHKLIPVGQKELNGKVENSHKQDDREFFSQFRCLSFESLKLHSSLYNTRWNEQRRRKALNWKTPLEVIDDSFVVQLAWMIYFEKSFPALEQTLVKRDENLNAFLPVIEQPVKKFKSKKTKTQKKSALWRYQQYLSWLEKKSS